MKLLIDTQPAELPSHARSSFSECCGAIMEQLLDRDRSISNCKLDGKTVVSMADGESRFPAGSLLEIETGPVQAILHESVTRQCEAIERLEAAGGELVTESLVGDPEEVLVRWQSFCASLGEQVRQLPSLCGLLGEEQAEDLASRRLEALGAIMKSCGESLSKADVVAISDALELQLLPWLREFRELVRGALSSLTRIKETTT